MNYYRVFFTVDGSRWWHDIWATSSVQVKRAAARQSYVNVMVSQHEGVHRD